MQNQEKQSVMVYILLGVPKKIVPCFEQSQQHGTIFLGHPVYILGNMITTVSVSTSLLDSKNYLTL